MPTPRHARYTRALAIYRDTSREALASVIECLPAIDARIVRALTEDDGMTCAEVEEWTGLKHQTVSAQIRHMAEAGLLEDSTVRRATPSGRAAIVWRVVSPSVMTVPPTIPDRAITSHATYNSSPAATGGLLFDLHALTD